jgi:serine/threonine-protein kinase
MEVGSSLSHYRITAKLGEGGMGQVFRAHDEHLKREVAIKVLPPHLVGDPDKMMRLEREAQVLAQLEHPNIASIYGIEQADGTRFLVMQMVEGQNLHERLDAGSIPLDEALNIALQIARALESAHDKGIVHRDLKPANIMIDEAGSVKLLDFGLAKAFASDTSGSHPEVSASPTMLEATQAGVILGTAGYMSPEQARGRSVDRRTDVWAFGCVLYEMLTANRVFGGETVTDILGAIVHRDPDWDALPAETPRRIRALLNRCLRKDLERRIQAIGDARVSIEEYLEDPEAAESILDAGMAEAPSRPQWVPWAAVAALAVALAGSLVMNRGEEVAEGPTLRLDMMIGVSEELRDRSLGSSLIISPSGTDIAIVTGSSTQSTELKFRPLSGSAVTTLTGGAVYNPFFSPDGTWIGFTTPSSIQKIPVTGGTPLDLAEVNFSRGATWTDANEIVYAPTPSAGLSVISADGGEPRPLTSVDELELEVTHRWPQWLADTRRVLFTAHSTAQGAFDGAVLKTVDIDTGEQTIVYRGGYYGRYVASGHILFLNDGTLFAIPFDLNSNSTTGGAAPVATMVADDPANGGGQYSVSRNGTLVHRIGESGPGKYPAVWLDPDSGAITSLLEEPRTYVEARVSPNGQAVVMTELTGSNWDVWVYDIARGTRTRLTFSDGIEGPAVWSPDSTELIYTSDEDGSDDLYRKRADGSGSVTQLTTENFPIYVSDWSPDGRYVIGLVAAPEDAERGWRRGADLGYLDLESDEPIQPYLASDFGESEASFSPDGRWVAYQSNESGSTEVYVRPFPPSEGRWQISDAGGGYPRWAKEGSRLFYRSDSGIMSVTYTGSGDSFSASKPRLVSDGQFLGGPGGLVVDGSTFADYDVAPDGRLLLFPGSDEAISDVRLARVVVNWFPELRRLAPPR